MKKKYDPSKVVITFNGQRLTPYTYDGIVQMSKRRPDATDLDAEARKRYTGGKIDRAPCGHIGEHVFTDYIRCLEGCEGTELDAVPEHIDPEKTKCMHVGTGLYTDPITKQRVRICLNCKAHL